MNAKNRDTRHPLRLRGLHFFCLSIGFALSAAARADCSALWTRESFARIEVISFQARQNKSQSAMLGFRVLGAHTYELTMNTRNRGQTPLGPLDVAIRSDIQTALVDQVFSAPLFCEHGICEILSRTDLSNNTVIAQVKLLQECPDAGAQFEVVRMQFFSAPLFNTKRTAMMSVQAR